jgi:transcriptional regulator with XRE-family HTH domain
MADDTDRHIGGRLRRRRRLLGLTQQQLGDSIGISASRLFELAEALDVPVQYFYEGLQRRSEPVLPDGAQLPAELMGQRETTELLRAYYRLKERPRRRLLELALSLDPGEQALDTDAA